MSARPTALGEVSAQLTGQAPKRLVRKLDQDPRRAEAWGWAESDGAWSVTTPTGEVVTLRAPDGVVRRTADVSCSCLLAPRCLHVLACVSLLDLAELAGDGAEEDGPAPGAGARDEGHPAALAGALGEPQAEARDAIWRATVALLDVGALAAGPVPQAELLRAVHTCRAVGLHRLARAGLRVVQAVRELRGDRAGFTLDALAADVFDLLGTCHRLRVDAAPAPERVGVARRAYAELGALSLRGVCSEAVRARTGYAGVVTTLCDGEGRLWTVSGVLPDAGVDAAYTTRVRLGGAALTHQELARGSVLVQGATGSADGRLGSGQGVKAVRGEPSSWDVPPLRDLFRRPLAAQLERAWAALATPPLARAGGADLMFLTGTILGASRDALWVGVAPAEGQPARPLRCVAPTADPSRPTLDTLRLLARGAGAPVRLVGRLRPKRARTLALLAVGPPESGAVDDDVTPRLDLPASWGTVCNVTLDALQRMHLPGAAQEPHQVEVEEPLDPWIHLRRRLQRLVLGGRGNLPASAGPEVDRERALLRRRLCPTGAELLSALYDTAQEVERGVDGRRASGDAERLAAAWLRAQVYLEGATRAEQRLRWGAAP